EQRGTPGGNLALVPPYSEDLLQDVGFEDLKGLTQAGSGKRLKGWLATPLWVPEQGKEFGVRLTQGPGGLHHTGQQHVSMGYGGPANGKVASGARAILAQQVRNPRAGKFTFSVHA